MPAKLEAPAIAPTITEAIAPNLENEVLVQYDPTRRPEGEFGQSKLIAFYVPTEGEAERLVVRPGVQRMPRAEWLKWESNTAEVIKAARSHGVLRKVSDKTDLLAIEREDPYLAQDILKNTWDGLLLGQWAKSYLELSPVLQEAMTLKSESSKGVTISKPVFMFGERVA